VLVVPARRASKVISHLAKHKEHAWVIGEIVQGEGVTIQ
jgi:phosphoribosylaminoimidazole (AIR) synthetase